MISSTKHGPLLKIEREFTALQQSLMCGLRDFGLPISGVMSSRMKSRSAWLWSRSPGSAQLQITGIVMSMELRTSHSQLKSPTIWGLKLSVTRNTDSSRWCDYCKARYGKKNQQEWQDKAQKPAVWVCTSEVAERKGRTRFYCNDCAIEVSTRQDGSFWALDEQMDYAIGKQTLDV